MAKLVGTIYLGCLTLIAIMFSINARFSGLNVWKFARYIRDELILTFATAGVMDAGIFGDIVCARMAKRGVAALVTDGVIRDFAACGRPIYPFGARAPRRRRP